MIDLAQERRDPTAGRGFADDAAPGLLSRIAERLAGRIERKIATGARFAARNRGFAQVQMTPEERVARWATYTSADLARLQQLHGEAAVDTERRDVQRFIASGVQLPEPVAPLGGDVA